MSVARGAALRLSPRLWIYRLILRLLTSLLDRRPSELQWHVGEKSVSGLALFHAASVGELESLWPVIMGWAAEGRPLGVTIFSQSAEGALNKLRKALAELPQAKVVLTGYAPREGSWQRLLAVAKPSVFVSAKYEAWPELWAALSNSQIPLVIVSARPRRSLRVCRKILSLLGVALPRIHFLASTDEDARGLTSEFGKNARITIAGEPRWDQVLARAAQGNARARELTEALSELPRPWGVLGQVWASDLDAWGEALRSLPGTLWLVPHRIEDSNVVALEAHIKGAGYQCVRTAGRSAQELRDLRSRVILVNEMGFLLELYAKADWAFIGGGFGASMHSTIEPAIFGLPIACGPVGRHRFSEIRELEAQKELRVVENEAEIKRWIDEVLSSASKTEWRSLNKARAGATQKVLQAVREAAITSP